MSDNAETEKLFASISARVDGEKLTDSVPAGQAELDSHPNWNELLEEQRNAAEVLNQFLSVDNYRVSASVSDEIEAMVNIDPNLVSIGRYIDGEANENDQKKVEKLIDEDQTYYDAYTEQIRAQNAIEELLNVDRSAITSNVNAEIESLTPQLDDKVVRLKPRGSGNFIQRALPLAAVFALGAVISPAILQEYRNVNQTDAIVLRGGSGSEISEEIVTLRILEDNQIVGADKLLPSQTPFAIQLYSEINGEAYLYLATSEKEFPDEIQMGDEFALGSVSKGQIVNFPKNSAITVDQTDKQLRVDFIIKNSDTRRDHTYYFQIKQ